MTYTDTIQLLLNDYRATGDIVRRKELIMALTPLAKKYAHKYSGAATQYFYDLYQEAAVAIIETVDLETVPTENFIAYCTIAVKSKLSKFRFNNSGSVVKRRDNRSQLKIYYNLHKLTVGKDLSHNDCIKVAAQLDVPVEEVIAYVSNSACINLDDEKNEAVFRLYADSDPALTVEKEELISKALEHIETLHPCMQDAVAHKLSGTKNYGKSVINNLAAEMGMSSAWMKEIVNNVLNNLNADVLEEERRMPTIQDIAAVCCSEYGVKHKELLSTARTHNIAFVRNLVMYLARHYTRLSLVEVAKYLHCKDHTAVRYGVNRFKKMSLDEGFSKELERLKEKIESRDIAVKS